MQVGEGNKHRRAIKAEKLAMRMAIYPVLQAEEDRRYVLQMRQGGLLLSRKSAMQ